ncbi:MAG: SHOCT domain-containing protein [Bacteroidales bacterium]
MGILFFVLFGVIVVAILLYFKKNGPVNRVDKTAWDPSERNALEILKERLATGDITQEEYDELKKRIEQKS